MIGRSRHRSSFVQSYEAGESKTWAADFNKVKITQLGNKKRRKVLVGRGCDDVMVQAVIRRVKSSLSLQKKETGGWKQATRNQ